MRSSKRCSTGLRRAARGALLAMVLAVLPSGSVLAQETTSVVPSTIVYQGFLADADGVALNGSRALTFRLYADDTAVWQETQTVALAQGRFIARLGSQQPIPPELFAESLSLGVQVEQAAELAPRQALGAVPYAFAAASAERLGDRRVEDLDQSAHVADRENPHDVTAAQVGAAGIDEFEAHLKDEDAHGGGGASSFAELSGRLGANQLPTEAATDAEVATATASLRNSVYLKAETDALIASLREELVNLRNRVAALEAGGGSGTGSPTTLLDGALRREGNTVILEGVNLVLRNGAGSTETSNGLGNLIIGYNEGDLFSVPLTLSKADDAGGTTPGIEPLLRDGSHNLVLGTQNDYTSYGGLVGGQSNRSNAPFAVVLTGNGNTAQGRLSAVVGGGNNVAQADFSAVLGGSLNRTEGFGGTISGGSDNRAAGVASSVAGGNNNIASGSSSVVVGGLGNESLGTASVISGGSGNRTSGANSVVVGGLAVDNAERDSVSGLGDASPLAGVLRREGDDLFFEGVNVHIVNGAGASNTINGLGNLIVGYNEGRGERGPDVRTGSHNIVAGRRNNFLGWGGIVNGEFNELNAQSAALLGGRVNTIGPQGDWAALIAGNQNRANNVVSAVVGGYDNRALGNAAVVVGGQDNAVTDTSETAVVIGGYGNQASGLGSALLGGLNGLASGTQAAVIGGRAGLAAGLQAVTVGGLEAQAPGEQSATVGGVQVFASGLQSVAIGGSSNSASGAQALALGGTLNLAGGNLAVTLGGNNNNTSGIAIGGLRNAGSGITIGGQDNVANGSGVGLGGSGNNTFGIAIGGQDNTGIGISIGGQRNATQSADSLVLLGADNRIESQYGGALIAASDGSRMEDRSGVEGLRNTAIVGGRGHRFNGADQSVIVGGDGSVIFDSKRSAIFGGRSNAVNAGDGATVVGGGNNDPAITASDNGRSSCSGNGFVIRNRTVVGRFNYRGDEGCQ